MVTLIDWTEVVKDLDELRAARLHSSGGRQRFSGLDAAATA